jgi:hypothetical protein
MYDYDHVDRLGAKIQSEVRACEERILRGSFLDFQEYKLACMELKTWQRALALIEDTKKQMKKELL